MSGVAGTSMWRVAGMSYLEYTNRAAAVLRSALKEPMKSKAESKSLIHIVGYKWLNGVRGEKAEIDSLKKAAKAFNSA